MIKRCSYCKKNVNIILQKGSKIENCICPYCGKKGFLWEEEFEDKLWVENESGLVTGSNYKTIDITDALVKYLKLNWLEGMPSKIKVKIKARKGAILIERTD